MKESRLEVDPRILELLGPNLYTNSDDEACRVPEGRKVHDYLREFFVESYSTQKIYVLFVTSENTKTSWGAITEICASWITKIDHKIFNIRPFRPDHPLNDEEQSQSTNRDEASGDLSMNPLNADIFCGKIEAVCRCAGLREEGPRAKRGPSGHLSCGTEALTMTTTATANVRRRLVWHGRLVHGSACHALPLGVVK